MYCIFSINYYFFYTCKKRINYSFQFEEQIIYAHINYLLYLETQI